MSELEPEAKRLHKLEMQARRLRRAERIVTVRFETRARGTKARTKHYPNAIAGTKCIERRAH
jgi:hypothetical protein